MKNDLVAFSCPLMQNGSSLSTEEMNAQCKAIERELLTLAPALKFLKASRLIHRISLRSEVLMVDFLLLPQKQQEIQFGSTRKSVKNNIRDRLWADYQMVIESIAKVRQTMSLIVSEISQDQFNTSFAYDNYPLRKLMRANAGRSLRYATAQGNMEIDFPEVPKVVVSTTTTRIRCRVRLMGEDFIEVANVRIFDSLPANCRLHAGKAIKVEFSQDVDHFNLGQRLLPYLYNRELVEMEVHACYEPLLGGVVRLLLKKLLGEVAES